MQKTVSENKAANKIKTIGISVDSTDNELATLILIQEEGEKIYGSKIKKATVVPFYREIKGTKLPRPLPLPEKLKGPNALIVNALYNKEGVTNEGRLFLDQMKNLNVENDPFWQMIFHDIFITNDRQALGGYMNAQRRYSAKMNEVDRCFNLIDAMRIRIETMREDFEKAKDAYNKKAEVRHFICRDETINVVFIKTPDRNTFIQTIAHKLQENPAHAVVHFQKATDNDHDRVEWSAYHNPDRRMKVISLQEENPLLAEFLLSRLRGQEIERKGVVPKNEAVIKHHGDWVQANARMIMTKRNAPGQDDEAYWETKEKEQIFWLPELGFRDYYKINAVPHFDASPEKESLGTNRDKVNQVGCF
jgi:hypothetical protein